MAGDKAKQAAGRRQKANEQDFRKTLSLSKAEIK
jgi:hypothetical protein